MTGIKVGLSFPQGAHMVTFPGGPTLMVDGMVVYPVPPMVPPDVITRAELRIAGCPTETVVLTD